VTERAVLLAAGPEIGLADLPRVISGRFSRRDDRRLLEGLNAGASAPAWVGKPLVEARREVLAAFERTYLTSLLEEARGRIGEAARRAGINERSLFELMKRHRLSKERFRVRAGEDQGPAGA
jgi:DNA-binding NtrC family response regulator